MLTDVVEKLWDVIVIGAGMGGGTVGRRLAEKGLSVLFVERGQIGSRAEQNYGSTESTDSTTRLVRGLWPEPMNARINGRTSQFFSGIGAGVGGTSAFYAAALERPEMHDIDHSAERPHPTGGWPEPFQSWLPYFDDVEKTFHVCGEQDPRATTSSVLLPPPSLTTSDKAIMDRFRRNGLNPYHSHLGIRFLPGCDLCLGHKCPRACKMDGRSAGVEPALETGNAAILDLCEVKALHGTKNSITHIEARRGDEDLKLRAKQFILAAGAFGSPRILLASQNDYWPNGCANSSGLVGRNLMFHLTEMLAIWAPRGTPFQGASKAITLRDFYYHNNHRLGMLQSMGLEASYGVIANYLKGLFDRSALRNMKRLRRFSPLPAYAAAKLFGKANVFAGIIEDLPYSHNRVIFDRHNPSGMCFEYTIADELVERRRQFRQLVRKRTSGIRSVFLNMEPELNFPHCCGTLRFGNDPSSSVLDKFCRSHDIHNLYSTDSSFMPTSLGVNPSLVIAANAMRVGDRIANEYAI